MTAILSPKYELHMVKIDAPISAQTGIPLPYGSAFMLPGHYQWGGQVYDCTQPGLYTFQENGFGFQKRLVCWNGTTPFDIYDIMSAFSWNHTHGWDMDSWAWSTISNAGRTQKWRLTCGKIAGLCKWYFDQIGVTSRIVNVLTVTGPITNSDDGHVVIEVSINGSWVMFDMTYGCYYKDSSGNPMNTQQIVDFLANNPTSYPERVYLHDADKSSAETPGGFCHSTYYEHMHATEELKNDWIRRVFQQIV